jgi:hypothetical protein
MSVKIYQERLSGKLLSVFEEAIPEWRPFRNRNYGYTPIPDIAVGPFAIDENQEMEYSQLVETHGQLIQSLINRHNSNARLYAPDQRIRSVDSLIHSNSNARCLFCIEIENQVTRKHIIGGLINASALGRVAVLIGWDDRKVQAMFEQRMYMNFLQQVGKNHFYTNNVVILSPHQFEQCVDEYILQQAQR